MLYIVGTAIGNIEDTTYRAIRTLVESDIILAEDTRTFKTYYQRIQDLFELYPQNKQEVLSFYTENEFQRISYVIEQVKQGKQVTLVSESGMPVISDPGLHLIQHAIKNDTQYTVIPGPTAFVTAAVQSGLDVSRLLYIGFLPKKEKDVRNTLTNIEANTAVAFYESPERINKTLEIIDEMYSDANIVIARELTKKFEQIYRGKAADFILEQFKGEVTIVLQLNQS